MLDKFNTDYGLLIIRLGVGVLFMFYGYPMIIGGVKMWTEVGGAMKNIHVDFAPAFWGFLAALAEFGGGFCLVLGFLFRPALAMMIFTMAVAILLHRANGEGFNGYSHALESALVFLGLFITGPGKYALKITRR